METRRLLVDELRVLQESGDEKVLKEVLEIIKGLEVSPQ
jgi:hypothetical protein